jgi:NADPH-dependent 2,4-dienoyl-CoA reductase/sulfur reductase-like enzyme/ferredoxin
MTMLDERTGRAGSPPPTRTGPPSGWIALRLLSLALLAGEIVTLLVDPALGLFELWHVIVPLLPLLFFVAPGLWRNMCPVSAANQLARVVGLSRDLQPPRFIRHRGYLIGIGLLTVIIPARRVLLNESAPATALLLVGVTACSFVGGVLFTGKSGWCSSMCPMLPIERFYGQTPFLVMRNNHCEPCVGCAKNCYDADPLSAYQNDLSDGDRLWREPRRLFAGSFPGMIAAFFLLPEMSTSLTYAAIIVSGLAGWLVFLLLAEFNPELGTVQPAIFAAIALNGFYFFAAPDFLHDVGRLDGHDLLIAVWVARVALAMLTLWWLARTFHRNLGGVAAVTATAVSVAMSPRSSVDGPPASGVRFVDRDTHVEPLAGTSLLEAAEQCGVAMTGQCRVGMCGADPIAVLAGAKHLSELGDEEATTLRRLGLPTHVRLACSARTLGTGGVSISTNPDDVPAGTNVEEQVAPSAITSVVIIGNGVAGVTAAEEVRRLQPDCDIHLIGRESFQFYNRMAISRIVYDRNAMIGLAVKPDEFYDEQRITSWLNTQVRAINRGKRTVELATGEVLPWDRLILATGSSSNVPPIPGANLDGVFVLREATDALALRAYAQEHGARHAAVVGGGLLGLEAAHALHQLGLQTTVLEGAPRLLPRFLDEEGSQVMAAHFDREGVAVRCGVTVEAIVGQSEVDGVHLGEHGHVPADLVVICAGITPNVDLARSAGLVVNRGIVVDTSMRTSAAGIFAAGDTAEFDGAIVGLWATAATQAEVAARNALGGDETYEPVPPAAVLKGAGIELTSVGRITPEPDDRWIRRGSPTEGTYALLRVDSAGRLAGAILIGRPGPARHAVTAMHGDRDPTPVFAALGEDLTALGRSADSASWPPPRLPQAVH